MPLTGSYDVHTFSTSADGEIRRLNAQLDLFWEKEYALYVRLGLADGMQILDCGCGPGYLSEKLLFLLPHSNVTAVEMDPSLVAFAEQRLAKFINNGRSSVIQNSILNLKFPDNTFDFIITRLVVEHVTDPEAACKELYRVLKPKGIAVIIDNDFEMHVRTFPHISELDELYNAYCRARSDEGGNPKIGRELPLLMKKTGFTNVDLEIICAHSVVIGDGPFLKSEGPGIPKQLVEDGYLASETYQTIVAKWHGMLKKSEHAIVRQLYVSSGRKGTGLSDLPIITGTDKKMAPLIDGNSSRNTGDSTYTTLINSEDIESTIELVRNHVSRVLDSASKEIIRDDIALTDIGIDSELAMDLQESLTAALPLKKPLPATLVFDYPTIRAIARCILENLKDTLSSNDSGTLSKNGITEKLTSSIDDLSDEEIEKRLTEKLDLLDKE